MLGSSRRRDSRRKGASERFKKNIAQYRIEARGTTDPSIKKWLEDKIEKLQKTLANTEANMGKGSSQMRVRNSKKAGVS